jgi:hypothetical protein
MLSFDAAEGSTTGVVVEWLAATKWVAELNRGRVTPGALETDNGAPSDGKLDSDRASNRSVAIARASSRMRTRLGRVIRRWLPPATLWLGRDAQSRAPRVGMLLLLLLLLREAGHCCGRAP